MTNRRELMMDAEGSRALIYEYADDLVYKIDRLVDTVLDLEDEVNTLEQQNIALASTIETQREEIDDLKWQLKEL